MRLLSARCCNLGTTMCFLIVLCETARGVPLFQEPSSSVQRGFLTAAESERLVHIGRELLKAVPPPPANHTTTVKLQDLTPVDQELADSVLQRAARLAGLPVAHAEGLYLSVQKPGQSYGWHWDSAQKSQMARILGLPNGVESFTRVATVLCWLTSHPAHEGGTIFEIAAVPAPTEASRSPLQRCLPDTKINNPAEKLLHVCSSACQPGDTGSYDARRTPAKGGVWRLPATQGTAIMWFNHDRSPPLRGTAKSNGTISVSDTLSTGSRHASCPIASGERWVAQVWFHPRPWDQVVSDPELAKSAVISRFKERYAFHGTDPRTGKCTSPHRRWGASAHLTDL